MVAPRRLTEFAVCVTVGAALETANGDVFVGAWVDTASSLDSALSIQPRPQSRSSPTRGQRATPRRAPWLGERFDTWPGRRAHPVSSRFRGCTRLYSLVSSIAICAGDGVSIDQRTRLIDATCPHKRAAVSERHLEEVPAPASTQ